MPGFNLRQAQGTGFQIVGRDKARHPAKKAEHADMGLDPVRQFQRPGRLGVSVIGGGEDGDEDLRFMHGTEESRYGFLSFYCSLGAPP
jgi:hypothetical protein